MFLIPNLITFCKKTSEIKLKKMKLLQYVPKTTSPSLVKISLTSEKWHKICLIK